jgi:biopolymer transport protein ExbD
MDSGFRISTDRRRRGAGDTFVPMINIVFLLLIFFMLSATIAPPDPFDLTLPDAALAEADVTLPPDTLHVSAQGELAFAALQGDAALAAIAARPAGSPLTVRADAALDGADFAALLARLAAVGVGAIDLTVRQP